MNAYQPFARIHKTLDRFLGDFSPARPVIVEHQNIVSGKRRLRDSHRLFFHSDVKASTVDKGLP